MEISGAALKANALPPEIGSGASTGAVSPEVLAAIAAGIRCAMNESVVQSDLLAVLTTVVAHHIGGTHVIRHKRTTDAWVLAGRQKLMDSRQNI